MAFVSKKLIAIMIVFAFFAIFEAVANLVLPNILNLTSHILIMGVVSVLLVNGALANKENKSLKTKIANLEKE